MDSYLERIQLCETCAAPESTIDICDNDEVLEDLWEAEHVPSQIAECDNCGDEYICTTWIAEITTIQH